MTRRFGDVVFLAVHGIVLGLCALLPLSMVQTAWQNGSAPDRQDLERWMTLLGNTAIVVGLAAVVALPLGTVLGVLLFRTRWPGRALAAAIAVTLVCVPLYVSGTALLAVVGIPNALESAVAAGLLYGVVLTPLSGLVIGNGLRQVPATLEAVARLHRTALGVLWSVSLPTVRWHLGAAALLVAFVTGTDYFMTDILQVRTFAEEIYTQHALHGAQASPLHVGLPIMIALVALFAAAFAWRPAPPDLDVAAPAPLGFGRGRLWVTAVVLGLLIAMGWVLLRPLLSELGGLSGYRDTVATIRPELRTSQRACLIAATLCTLLAPGLAWFVLQRGWLRWLTLVVLLSLLCMPGPTIGITLIRLLNRDALGALYDSPNVLVVGMLARFLPLAVLLMVPALERVPRELHDAARLDGLGIAGLHLHVVLPLCLRRLAIVWLVMAVFAFGETACSVLIAPPGHTPLAVRFFTLIHYGIYQEAAAVVLRTMQGVLIPAGLAAVLFLRPRTTH